MDCLEEMAFRGLREGDTEARTLSHEKQPLAGNF